jgi:hypothetical protein
VDTDPEKWAGFGSSQLMFRIRIQIQMGLRIRNESPNPQPGSSFQKEKKLGNFIFDGFFSVELESSSGA